MKISSDQIQILKAGLTFFHVDELKEMCVSLSIADTGKKMQIIERITHFIETGALIIEPKIPAISRAKRGQVYLLRPEERMLKGAYKNDLRTRLFFKELIGEYFHFTAHGIDWLNDRWMQGNPPTYQEFAAMWQAEHERRQDAESVPKEEWAYIKFTQNFIYEYPHATRKDIVDAWEVERQKQKVIVHALLQKFGS